MSELPTLNIFENNGNWVKVCEMSELPSHVRTPDPQGIWKLAVGHWLSTGHVRYDHHSELSKSVKHETSEFPTIVGTPDRRNTRLTSELSANQPEINNITIAGQIPDTSGIARRVKNRLALLSLKHSKLTWVGMSNYE